MLTVVSASHVAAQRLTVDVGGAAVRYADTLNTGTLSVTPALRLESLRASLRAAATFSQLSRGGWTTQGSLGTSLYTPNAGPLLGELAATAGGTSHQDGTRTGQAIAIARAHVMRQHLGAWGGLGAGATWDGDVWRDVRQAEAGAWIRAGSASTMLTFTPTAVDDSVDYVEMQFSLRIALSRIELTASAGHRYGDAVPALGRTKDSWGSVGVVAWVTPWAAVVANAGSYPVDLTQGFPGGRYATLGIRFGASPRRVARDVLSAPVANGDPGSAASGVSDFAVIPASDGQQRFRLRAPAARSVEVAGDFTAWQSLPMSRAADGSWEITLPVAPGTYHMNLRIDSGSWITPPGLTAMTDEFGGRVAILVVRAPEM